MKIAFTIEYFIPHAKGGSEWSTYYLAKSLVKKGHQIVVITPNYGNRGQEVLDGIKIVRFPFYLKMQKRNTLPGNFFFTNPLWIIWSAFFYLYYLKKEKVDIINIQGKYSILPSRIANFFLKLPTVSTVRDYQLICNYGVCLNSKQKACTLREYFTIDFRHYYKNYVQKKNSINLILNLLYAVWGRFSKNILKLSTFGQALVVLSNPQKEIFKKNGFKNLHIIANPMEFTRGKRQVKKEKLIIYAGRLTPGKGVNILINILPKIIAKFPGYKFIFAGEGMLKGELQSISKTEKNIEVLGQVPHKELLALFAKAEVAIVPSIWPEPFGRVALEALSQKTPVVVSSRGALPEIVDKRWGIIIDPTEEKLFLGLKKAIELNSLLVSNIDKDFNLLRKRFQKDPVENYISFSKRLLK